MENEQNENRVDPELELEVQTALNVELRKRLKSINTKLDNWIGNLYKRMREVEDERSELKIRLDFYKKKIKELEAIHDEVKAAQILSKPGE